MLRDAGIAAPAELQPQVDEADVLFERMPEFLYFSSYDRTDGRVQLEALEAARTAKTLNAGQQNFQDFLDFAGTGAQELQSATTFEKLKAKVEAASLSISKQVFSFWSQNKNPKVEFTLEAGRSGDPAPFNTGHVMHTRIRNRHPRARQDRTHTQQSTKSSTCNALNRSRTQLRALESRRECQICARTFYTSLHPALTRLVSVVTGVPRAQSPAAVMPRGASPSVEPRPTCERSQHLAGREGVAGLQSSGGSDARHPAEGSATASVTTSLAGGPTGGFGASNSAAPIQASSTAPFSMNSRNFQADSAATPASS